MKRTKGFSLLQLLITMAIVAIGGVVFFAYWNKDAKIISTPAGLIEEVCIDGIIYHKSSRMERAVIDEHGGTIPCKDKFE